MPREINPEMQKRLELLRQKQAERRSYSASTKEQSPQAQNQQKYELKPRLDLEQLVKMDPLQLKLSPNTFVKAKSPQKPEKLDLALSDKQTPPQQLTALKEQMDLSQQLAAQKAMQIKLQNNFELQLNEKQNQILELEAQLKKQSKDSKDVQIQKLKEEIWQLQRGKMAGSQLEVENQALKQKIKKLEQQVGNNQNIDVAQLQNELKEWQEQVLSQSIFIEQLRNELQEQALILQQEHKDTLEKSITHFESQSQEKIANYETKLQTLNQENMKMRANIERQQQEHDKLREMMENRNQALQNKLEESIRQNDELMSEFLMSQSKIEENKQEEVRIEQIRQQNSTRERELVKQLQKLRDQISQYQQEIQELQKSNIELKNQKNSLDNSLKRRQTDQLSISQVKQQIIDDYSQKLRAQLIEYESKISSLELQLQKQKAESEQKILVMKNQCQQENQRIYQENQMQIQNLNQELINQMNEFKLNNESAIQDLVRGFEIERQMESEKHAKELAKSESFYVSQIDQLKAEFQREYNKDKFQLDETRLSAEQSLKQLQRDSENNLKQLQKQHADKLKQTEEAHAKQLVNHQHYIKELQEKHSQEISRLREDYQAQIHQQMLELSNSKLKSQSDFQSEIQVQNLKTQIETLNKKHSQQLNELFERQQQFQQNFEETFKKSQFESHETQRQLNEQIEQKDAFINDLKAQIQKLNLQLKEFPAEIQELQNEIQILKHKNQKFQAQESKQMAEKEENDSFVNELKENLNHARKQLQKQEQNNQMFKQDNLQLQQINKQLLEQMKLLVLKSQQIDTKIPGQSKEKQNIELMTRMNLQLSEMETELEKKNELFRQMQQKQQDLNERLQSVAQIVKINTQDPQLLKECELINSGVLQLNQQTMKIVKELFGEKQSKQIMKK